MAAKVGITRPGRVVTAGCALIVIGVLTFVMLILVAASVYPGGTWADPSAEGYTFATNFWCDLLRSRAINGEQNPGVGIARAGMLALAVALFPFFVLLPRLFPRRRRMSVAVRLLGVLGSLGAVFVVLLPSDRFPFFHGLTITVATPAGIAAAVLGVFGLAETRHGNRIELALGSVMLLCALGSLAQYAREFWFRGEPWPHLPLLQKTATVLFLAWMIAVAVRVFRTSSAPARA